MTPKPYIDPCMKLSQQYKEFLHLFHLEEANQLLLHCGEGIDHKIKLILKDGKNPEVPWGPLYSMS